MTTNFPEDPFWDFSLRVYAKEPVRKACLQLQDRFRCDVNLVLFCVWSGAEGPGVLAPEFIATAADVVAGWNDDVVKHLRVTRWMVERGFPELDASRRSHISQCILAAELDAEHEEQLMLSQLIADQPGNPAACGPSAVVRNLVSYLHLLNVSQNDVANDAMAGLIKGVFGHLSEHPARSLLTWS